MTKTKQTKQDNSKEIDIAFVDGIEQGKQAEQNRIIEIIEKINNYEVYDLMHRGFTISPTLGRDEYLQEKYIKFSELIKEIKQGEHTK